MSSDHFGQLPKLEELRIQYCKLRHLPPAAFAGLTNLKNLEIHSHNDDWASVLMDVHKDTFQKLVNLRHLNLAFNNLWSLPPGSLCDMINLQRLNLSHNHLLGKRSISDRNRKPNHTLCKISLWRGINKSIHLGRQSCGCVKYFKVGDIFPKVLDTT